MSSFEKSSYRDIANNSDNVVHLLEKNRDLKLELKQVKKAHRTVLNNLKAVAFKEAVNYLKMKSAIIIDLLTRTHRRFIKQFINHKKRSAKITDGLTEWKERIQRLDAQYVKRAPVEEAEYQMTKATPLELYDCLIPKL